MRINGWDSKMYCFFQWSFGIVLWELLSRGMKPYPGVDNLDIKRFLKRGDRLEKPSHSPPEV